MTSYREIINALGMMHHELERHLLMTGPTLLCDYCGAELERINDSTFEDLPHTPECILLVGKKIIKKLEADNVSLLRAGAQTR